MALPRMKLEVVRARAGGRSLRGDATVLGDADDEAPAPSVASPESILRKIRRAVTLDGDVRTMTMVSASSRYRASSM